MKHRLIYIFVLILLSLQGFAQSRISVIGRVLDENGQPLAGAGVFDKADKSNGVVTDIDGKYTISVPANATLIFNFLNYKEEEIALGGRRTLDVRLEPDINLLDEVVVVGYGTMKRSDLTGAVASVSAKTVEKFKTASVVEALGGQIAGVNITAADGTPGGGYDIKIRGVGTVNGDASPLFIVDGFEVDDIDYLANQDIQSVEVLKDASAASIYGARAANGVVLVTTKNGREGKPQINYNGSASYRVLSKRLELLSPYEFVKLQMEINPTRFATTYFNSGNDDDGNPYKYQAMDDYRSVAGIDWQDEAFRPTWSQNHEVSVRGGNKESNYSISFSHFDEDGIFRNSGYRKDNARVKVFHRLGKNLSLSLGLSYTNSNRYGAGTGGRLLANLLRYRPTGGLRVSDYDLRHSIYDPLALDNLSNFDSSNANPLLQVENQTQERKQEQWIGNGSLSYQISRHLSFKTAATYNANYQRTDIFYKEGTSQCYRAGGPYGQSQMGRALRWSNNNVLSYKNTFAQAHKLDLMLGHETSFQGNEYLLGQAKDLPFDDLGNDNLALGATPSQVSTTRAASRRLSFFARGFYSYKDRYMLTATMRADASTVFSDNHKWGFFPSFAAAWTISNEDFMSGLGWLSNLKLRAGWGTVGNDRIANYLSLDLYSPAKWGLGTSQTTVLTSKQLANYDLKWEGSSTTNIGLDVSVLRSRINLTVDAFIKDTKDLLLAQNLAYLTGFESQWQNIGKIRNKGIEISLNTVNFNRKKFGWSTDFNISFIRNSLESLQDGTSYMFSRSGFDSNYSGYDYIAMVGSALGNMYGYKFDGVYQSSDFDVTPDGRMILKPGVADISAHAGQNVVPGFVKYKDIDGDGIITTADRTVIGNGQPDFFGGLTNNFNFWDFDFSFMLQFVVGNDVYNATRMYANQTRDERTNHLVETKDRWTATNASNKVPSAQGYIRSELYSRFVEDGSFLRLKNVTLGYTIPRKLLQRTPVKRARVYGTVQNLFCLTRYSGYDPEVNTLSSPLMPGFDWGAYPKSQTFTFGVEVQF